MNKLLRVLLPLLVVAAAFGVLRWQLDTRPVLSAQEPESGVPLVRVQRMSTEDRQLTISTHGTVQSQDVLPLAFEVGGRVMEISPLLEVGSYLRRGDLLVQLDAADFQLQLATATAGLEQAEAGLALERAAAEVAVQDWQALKEGEPSAVARREPQLAAARADVTAATAARDQAQRNLDRCRLTAPFDARVLSADVALGQVLAAGAPFAQLQPSSEAEIVLPLALDDLPHLGLDLAVREADLPVTLEADLGGVPLRRDARLVRSSPALDPASRMLRAVAVIDDPFGLASGAPPISPGLFVRATIRGRRAAGLYSVPRSAVLDGDRVLLADPQDRLMIRPVQVLQWTESEALVEGGLEDGDRLILTALPVTAEGMKLEVREDGR